MRRIYPLPGTADTIEIYQGEAKEWADPAVDLILTNPYGPIHPALYGRPMIVHQWVHRKADLQRWVGNVLGEPILLWNRGREAFWAANFEVPQRILRVVQEAFYDVTPEPGGWWPLELPVAILSCYGKKGGVLWDGFMGRGTCGHAARMVGMHYVGVERLSLHIRKAIEYLGLDPAHCLPVT